MSTKSGEMVDHSAATDSRGDPSADPISILLVDDEPKNLAVLESVLDNPNYRLVRAESADRALMALIAEEFALLILDIQMPDMNGFELAQMIKQRKRTASLPIIFLTAYYSEETHVVEGYSTGAVDYLHKPINPTILRSKVAVFAELYRKTRECSIANRSLSDEVAERRRTQEELSRLAEDLEQRVAQRTAELVTANAALRASEERFRLALENSRIFVCTTDRDLRYTWVSDQNAASLWRPVLGRRDDELVSPEQAQPLMALKERVLQSGVGERAGLSFDREGRTLHYDFTVEPLLDDLGAPTGVAIAAMEITDLKQAEAALKEADRRKDEFLATLAHELRNPLAPIRNAVQVLHLKESDPQAREWAKDVIDRQSLHMTRLVDDLLDISRITRDKLALRMQPVKLRDAVQGAVEAVNPLIESCGHQLTVDLPQEDLMLNGDFTRLSQVLSNLLNNAAKYTEPGGKISLIATRDNQDVCIRVKDNGVGIPAEMLPCVFEMFAQVDRHLDRAQGGLGIGLRLVKWLVEMHGGTIEASSAGAGKGSEFLIRLPSLVDSTTSAVDGPVPAIATASARLRVLIVDDNRDNVESLRLLLGLMGHDVRVAHDGFEGISAAEAFRPDIVLLDIGMPKLDGNEVCKRLRAYDWGRELVLIAQTGWGQVEDRRRTAAAGFDYHMVKPIDHEALSKLLAEICEKPRDPLTAGPWTTRGSRGRIAVRLKFGIPSAAASNLIVKSEVAMSVDRLIRVVATVTLLELIVTSGNAAETDPLTAVPGSCNAVAVVQMRKLVNSPLGKRHKWFDEARRAYAEGLLSGPPWVTEIVQATVIGSARGGQPLTYSVYAMNQPSIIGDIAKHELAPVEKLEGHGAVASPRNVFFIQLAPGLVAAVQPADRQAVSQWVHAFDEKRLSAISPDLIAALTTQESAQVSIAVQLKGKLNSRYILNWLVGTPKLRATDDIEGLARVLASLRMAHLSVQVTDTIVARLRLDFDSPIRKHAKAVEKAVVQWLDDAGARPQVLAAAKTSASDESLTFEVPLDEVGLRRLLSLIQSPQISPKELAGAETRQPNAVASAAYYNKVCDLLNSLLYKNRNASEYAKTALWHEQFARKIGGLSTIAVDPELVRWGRDVSKELVALASSLRGEFVKLDDLEHSIRFDDTTNYAWYGYSPLSGDLYFPAWVSSTDNLDAVRSQQDAQVEKFASDREAIWNMLYQGTAEIARKIESKYQIKLKLPK